MDHLYEDLINLGYPGEEGQGFEREDFLRAFDAGPPNRAIVHIISWLSAELADLCNLENRITPLRVGEDFEGRSLAFLIELSSLLKELNCPMSRLSTGPMEGRLNDAEDKEKALLFLISELQAARINRAKNPKKETSMKIELDESKMAKELKEMLMSLNFGKPPDNICPPLLFGEVEKKIKFLSHPLSPKDFIGKLLFSGCLTEKQWFQLEDLCKEMLEEYKTRRILLITRLDVTIQSFIWIDRLKTKQDVKQVYCKLCSKLSDTPNVEVSDVLAATPDLAAIDKTSSGDVRINTQSSVNRVLIGAVPDRGGRPEEQQPPPPEVPSWQSSSRGGRASSDRPTQRESSRQVDQPRQEYNSYRGGSRQQREDFSRGQRQDSQNPRAQFSQYVSTQPIQSSQSDVPANQPRQCVPPNQQRQDRQPNQGGGRGSPVECNILGAPNQHNPPNIIRPLVYDVDRPLMDRGDYINTAMFSPPRGQHDGHVPFGFGGYRQPAGDNFAQFGGYQSQPGGGDGPRVRGNNGGGGLGPRIRFNHRGVGMGPQIRGNYGNVPRGRGYYGGDEVSQIGVAGDGARVRGGVRDDGPRGRGVGGDGDGDGPRGRGGGGDGDGFRARGVGGGGRSYARRRGRY